MTLAAGMEMLKNLPPRRPDVQLEGVVVHISSARVNNSELLKRLAISIEDSTETAEND